MNGSPSPHHSNLGNHGGLMLGSSNGSSTTTNSHLNGRGGNHIGLANNVEGQPCSQWSQQMLKAEVSHNVEGGNENELVWMRARMISQRICQSWAGLRRRTKRERRWATIVVALPPYPALPFSKGREEPGSTRG